jgi:hypothetical protein
MPPGRYRHAPQFGVLGEGEVMADIQRRRPRDHRAHGDRAVGFVLVTGVGHVASRAS